MTFVGSFWGSRTSAGADVDGRAAATLVQQVVGSKHNDRPTPPDCFPGSVSCRHEDRRGPDTLLACLLHPVHLNPPICSFSPQSSLLMHFSVTAGKTEAVVVVVHSKFKIQNAKFKIQNANANWQLDAK